MDRTLYVNELSDSKNGWNFFKNSALLRKKAGHQRQSNFCAKGLKGYLRLYERDLFTTE
jgi:hypothetical protein